MAFLRWLQVAGLVAPLGPGAESHSLSFSLSLLLVVGPARWLAWLAGRLAWPFVSLFDTETGRHTRAGERHHVPVSGQWQPSLRGTGNKAACMLRVVRGPASLDVRALSLT